MQTRRLATIGGLIALAALNVSVDAAETGNALASARVRLVVSAPDSIRDSVISYLNRELNALNDVQLVDNAPQWEISVVALEIRSTRGYRGGIAVSTVVLNRFQNEELAPLFRPAEKAWGLAQTSNLWKYPSHSLHMDASDRLQIVCRQIVADFETKHLGEIRKRFRESQERRENAK